MQRTPYSSLEPLGFTALEAEVYARLLQESPLTGYAVARALRKPAANVYKALESLQGKGAILVDDGATRMCRAVPGEELLDRLERDFRARREEAGAALAELQTSGADDRVYALLSREQVLGRCRAMLRRARRGVLLDAFPEPLAEVAPELERLARRGVEVRVKCYTPSSLRGPRVVVMPGGEETLTRWPGHQLNVAVDAREHLLALLAPGGGPVLQAVWSASAYLSCLVHSWLAQEIAYTYALRRETARSGGRETAMRRELRGVLGSDYPGYVALLRRFAAPARPKEKRHARALPPGPDGPHPSRDVRVKRRRRRAGAPEGQDSR